MELAKYPYNYIQRMVVPTDEHIGYSKIINTNIENIQIWNHLDDSPK